MNDDATIANRRLTHEEARELTDDAKLDVAMLWAKLYALHEGGAHVALGYTDWGDYCEAEFGWTPAYGKRLRWAGEVRAALERKDPIGSLPDNESVARELSPVLHKAPDQLEDVWAEAVATTEHETPTAAEVRAVVDRRAPQVRPRKSRPTVMRLSRPERRFVEARKYTAHIREVERECGKAITTLRKLDTVDPQLSRWIDSWRRIGEHVEVARALLETRLKERQ